MTTMVITNICMNMYVNRRFPPTPPFSADSFRGALEPYVSTEQQKVKQKPTDHSHPGEETPMQKRHHSVIVLGRPPPPSLQLEWVENIMLYNLYWTEAHIHTADQFTEQ